MEKQKISWKRSPSGKKSRKTMAVDQIMLFLVHYEIKFFVDLVSLFRFRSVNFGNGKVVIRRMSFFFIFNVLNILGFSHFFFLEKSASFNSVLLLSFRPNCPCFGIIGSVRATIYFVMKVASFRVSTSSSLETPIARLCRTVTLCRRPLRFAGKRVQ